MTNCVALIPCRSGSKRIPDKNIKLLGGNPLIYWTIKAALESKVFDDVIVSTNSDKYADIARSYGAEVIMRPEEYATDISPDIQWVKYTLDNVQSISGRFYDCFSILRPTSPFRTPETIQRAWREFTAQEVDSLRAVEKCSQHPCKMWRIENKYMMLPLYPEMHSQPYQTLPEIYIQNASLEIAWTRVLDKDSISGFYVMPFFTQGYGGFDINTEMDWQIAEELIRTNKVKLPMI